MIDKRAAFDQAVEQLIQSWGPKLGPPTCSAGCSKCCQKSTIIVSTAEALRLLDFITDHKPTSIDHLRHSWEKRIQILRQSLSANMSEDEVIGSLLEPGGCVFLEDDLCGVYPERPDTCRSFYVWHSADYCSRPDFDMCSPAELKELRIQRIYEMMLDEVKIGHIPFWGHLIPMVWILDQHRDVYDNGGDLRDLVEPLWQETELVRFFDSSRGPDRLEEILKAEQNDFIRLFKEEPWPLGHPRAVEVSDRNQLAAFPIDNAWLQEHSRIKDDDD